MKIRKLVVLGLLLLLGLPQCTKTENRINEDGDPSEAYTEFVEQVELATNSACFQAEIFNMLLPDIKAIQKPAKKDTFLVHPTMGELELYSQ